MCNYRENFLLQVIAFFTESARRKEKRFALLSFKVGVKYKRGEFEVLLLLVWKRYFFTKFSTRIENLVLSQFNKGLKGEF